MVLSKRRGRATRRAVDVNALGQNPVHEGLFLTPPADTL